MHDSPRPWAARPVSFRRSGDCNQLQQLRRQQSEVHQRLAEMFQRSADTRVALVEEVVVVVVAAAAVATHFVLLDVAVAV